MVLEEHWTLESAYDREWSRLSPFSLDHGLGAVHHHVSLGVCWAGRSECWPSGQAAQAGHDFGARANGGGTASTYAPPAYGWEAMAMSKLVEY